MYAIALALSLFCAQPPGDRQTVLVVVGAGGQSEYAEQFNVWADRWAEVARRANANWFEVGRGHDANQTDRDTVRALLQQQKPQSDEWLWLVLIGHGTYDRHDAKFNVRGPDFSARELNEWLKEFDRPIVVINCSASSGPFINRLSGKNRVIVTATRNGLEQNYARFGDAFSAVISENTVDLDKDGQTSVLEAFLAASSRVTAFYDQEARLATEHALLDDNGDGLGTPATWFRGVRAVKTPKAGAESDGGRANQCCLIRSENELRMPIDLRTRRDALERQFLDLREKKASMDESEYYDQLKPILLNLATLYESANAFE